MKNCKNCETHIAENFCPHCGQPADLKKIDGKYLLHEIEHVLHFDRGILYTIRELLIRPGLSIRTYLREDRTKLVKPVIFIILTSLIYTLINQFFQIEDQYVQYEGLEQNPALVSIFKWFQGNYGYMNILSAAFIALWLKIFFKKPYFHFFELLIMLCFVMGIPMLVFALFALIEGFFHFNLLNKAGLLGIIYTIWAIGNFFGKGKWMNYLKALTCYLLGMITFFILIAATGIIIDMLTKP